MRLQLCTLTQPRRRRHRRPTTSASSVLARVVPPPFDARSSDCYNSTIANNVCLAHCTLGFLFFCSLDNTQPIAVWQAYQAFETEHGDVRRVSELQWRAKAAQTAAVLQQ
jgi:hypothetical protein